MCHSSISENVEGFTRLLPLSAFVVPVFVPTPLLGQFDPHGICVSLPSKQSSANAVPQVFSNIIEGKT